MDSGSAFLKELHLSSLCSEVKIIFFIGMPTILAFFSFSNCISSNLLIKSKKVKCSITDNGLEIPPVQNASQILSTGDFNSPVII
jgi:hypothetical protein|tara:strand:- start:752 stop:1006 length:255 start_codon:yes stop_codon:yes gene_type:complete